MQLQAVPVAARIYHGFEFGPENVQSAAIPILFSSDINVLAKSSIH